MFRSLQDQDNKFSILRNEAMLYFVFFDIFFFSSRRRHTRFDCDWSSDVCSSDLASRQSRESGQLRRCPGEGQCRGGEDRKSTRLNSSHSQISYAVFCLKKKKKKKKKETMMKKKYKVICTIVTRRSQYYDRIVNDT